MLALALCCGAAAAQGEKLIPLKVSAFQFSAFTNVWAAKRAGIFAKNGLDVQLIEFRSGNEAIAAQRGGHVDIVLAIPGSAMNANERGFDLVLVAQNETAQQKPPGSGALLVLKDSGIDNVSELAGKTIATSNLHSQYPVSVKTVLMKHGVDPSKVKFIELPFRDEGTALKLKQIDAAASLDPYTTEMRNAGYAKVISWAYIDAIPEQPIGAWWARADFVKKNPDAVARYAKAIRDSIEYMNADADRARRDVADYTRLKLDLIKDMPLNRWSYRIDPAKWQAVADMMHTSGELEKAHKASEYLSDVVQPFLIK
jgi:NitT/TauT family transport system substrate-binding protein